MKRICNILIILLSFVFLLACGTLDRTTTNKNSGSTTVLVKSSTSKSTTESIKKSTDKQTTTTKSETKSHENETTKAPTTTISSKTPTTTVSSKVTTKSTTKSTTISTKSTTKSTTITSKSTTKSTTVIPVTTYTVEFIDGETVVKTMTVNEGSSVTEVPTLVEEIGYDKVWEEVDLTNIHSNITVHSIKTLKTFTITLVFDDSCKDAFSLESYTITLHYGDEFNLPTPLSLNPDTYIFEGWLLNEAPITSGTYSYSTSIEVHAQVAKYTDNY